MTARGLRVALLAAGLALVPAAQPLPPYAVTVTPDGTPVTQPSGSGPFTAPFVVTNVGSAVNSYVIYCIGRTPVICDVTDIEYVTLEEQQSVNVVATYTTRTTPGTGRVVVGAADDGNIARDTGYYRVTVTSSGTPAAPVATAADPSPGPVIERSLCLALALTRGAAAECGDLRLVHALPATRTMNKTRVPTLLYNSQHAAPYPLVAANVRLPTGASVPQQVIAKLTLNGVLQPQRTWPGTSWTAGATRRVAIGADGTNLATGVYPYVLEIVNQYSGSSLSDTITGEVVIVNRQDSPFGAGWWLAGLERLDSLAATTKLWTGGDGSVRKYAPVGTNVWVAPNVDRPDTLKFDGTHYVRYLPGGLRVKFRSTDGRHVQTLNRLGHVTVFSYDACGRLTQIKLPPDTVSRIYDFALAAGDCTTRLVRVTAPPVGAAFRITQVTITSGRITTLQDPDLTTVQFGYGATHRVTTRTDRRGTVTTFTYDAANRVSQASTNMGAGPPALVTGVRALESVGFSTAVDTAWASARLDGPRTDVPDTTIFWLERFGQPRRIVNALGHSTLIKREAVTWPALATEVTAPNGLVTRASYDARGNVVLDSVLNPLGDGRAAVTRFEWDPLWDFVTKVVPPERDSTVLAYDATTGNRLWQQDARGTTGRTEFLYYASPDSVRGLLRSTRTPSQTLGGARDSVTYDARGNLRGVKTPLGFWTSQYADDIGRDTLVSAPTDSAQTLARRQLQRVFYDLADQDTLTRSVGPPLPYRASAPDSLLTSAETLWVRKRFDPEGNLDSLRRWGVPNPTSLAAQTTRWRYDRAHRAVAEVAPDGLRDSTEYDPAGNPIRQITRRGDTLRFTYTALNQLLTRITPAKSFPYTSTSPMVWHFPMYRADATGELNTLNGGAGGNFGLTIAADTATFTYDSLGNLRTANNRDARITRTYFRGGALASETQQLRTYVGTDFTQHGYTLQYTYDLNGRRLTLAHPANLVPGDSTDPVAYHYDAIGQLDTLRSLFGTLYIHAYDLEGRLDSIRLGRTERRVYDADGRVMRRSDPFHADTVRYDARGKVLRAGTMADSTHTRYTGLGAVTWSQTRRYVDQGVHPEEQYLTDAFASARSVFRRQNGIQIQETAAETRSVYDSVTGRLVQHGIADSASSTFSDLTLSSFDAAGNRVSLSRDASVDFNGQTRVFSERTANYYGADGRLRVADRRTCIFEGSTCRTDWGPDFTERQAFEEYRYDALGRRVLLRTRGEWGCGVEGCRRLLQRFVWDGDQLLWEISAPGATGEATATMERDVGHALPSALAYAFTGRVAYTHGLALDAPLAVHRMEHSQEFPDPFTMTPYTTWRGDYDSGVVPSCNQVWQPGPGPGDSTLIDVCVTVDWPAPYLWVAKLARARGVGPTSWHGSLIEGQRDLTGQLYRRNRYYDPASGRFTQEDPIGLAGGLNVYGFAAGDPVTLSDPFGLCASASDSILIPLTVRCPNGTTETRRVWAHRVPTDQLVPLKQTSQTITGGGPAVSTEDVQSELATLAAFGSVYVYPTRSPDGLLYQQGAVTRTDMVVAFRRDIWSAVKKGPKGMGSVACNVVGHEAVHLVQNVRGWPSGVEPIASGVWLSWRTVREVQAYSMSWQC